MPTLPKGSQGDEASSDHYLPIRVDCDHRSKLRGGSGEGAAPALPPPHAPTHPPRQRAGAQRAERGVPRGRMAGGAERGRGAPPRPPYPLPQPAAGRAHRRSAPAQPVRGAPHRTAPRTAPCPAPLRAAPRRQLRPAPPRGGAAPGPACHLAATRLRSGGGGTRTRYSRGLPPKVGEVGRYLGGGGRPHPGVGEGPPPW